MERKILKEKIRRLRVWILVIIMVVSGLFGNVAVEVLAATEMSISYNLNDSDDANSDAQITSTDHNTSVSYDESATGTATATLATATRTGYVFVEWDMADSDSNGTSLGYSYGAGKEVEFTAEALSAASNVGMIYLFAQWRPENQINITYSSAYGTLATTSVTYGENTNCTDGAATVTLPTVTDTGDNRTFIGWKCYAADSSGNKTSEITNLTGYNADIAATYENITVGGYVAGTELSIPYPTDTENAGGNIAYYIFEAQFVEKKSISYMFNASDAEAQISSTDYSKSVDYYGTTAEKATLPSATKENAFFVEWGIADSDGNLLTDSSGNTYTYPAGEATFSAEVLQAASSYDASTLYLVGTFTVQREETECTINLTYDAGDGAITSTDYTKSFSVRELAAEATIETLPVAEQAGYLFTGWTCDTEGVSYDVETGTLTWDTSAKDVTEISFTANYQQIKELNSNAIIFTAQWEKTEHDIIIHYAIENGIITSTNHTQSLRVSELDTSVENFVLPEVERTGFLFDGWLYETGISYNEESGILSWGIPAKEMEEITISARWTQIISGGTLSLQSDEKYHLSEGNWIVEGDDTVYVGDNDFYVSASDDYEFSEAEE